jgi:regulator of sirC expression with transglutaminase-like and TPR domain
LSFLAARERFQTIVTQPDDQIDLAVAALTIAQEDYPDLDIEVYLAHLDRMAAAVQQTLPAERYPLRIIKAINAYLYDELGFVGNTANYYDPRNSFLNDVLERRTGIPITLSLVYLEIAQRIDFPMVGVDMPAHFLIRPDIAEVEFLVDAFHHGEVMFVNDCQHRLEQIYGHPIAFDSNFLERTTPRRFLARLLSNLKMIYLNQEDWHKALATIERLLLLFPGTPLQVRDRGLLYYQLGNWVDARQDLQVYLDHEPDARDAAVIEQLLRRMGTAP